VRVCVEFLADGVVQDLHLHFLEFVFPVFEVGVHVDLLAGQYVHLLFGGLVDFIQFGVIRHPDFVHLVDRLPQLTLSDFVVILKFGHGSHLLLQFLLYQVN